MNIDENPPLDLTVLDAIDRPIRDLVLNINRIGLETKFSCCGFTYENEEEAKSHADHAFVIIKEPKYAEQFLPFLNFTRSAAKHNWKVTRYGPTEWIVRYERTQDQKDFWAKPSLHDYELSSIAIWALNKELSVFPNFNETGEFIIIDGNQSYHDLGIHWNIKPKTSVTVKTKVLETQPT